MSFLQSECQSLFYEHTNIWGSRNGVLVDCDVQIGNDGLSATFEGTGQQPWLSQAYIT